MIERQLLLLPSYRRRLRPRVDSEHITELRRVAENRGDFYAQHAIRFPSDARPTEAAATLRSRFYYLPAGGPAAPLSDFASYPAYLFTQLARKFPNVHCCDLEHTIQKLAECHNRCAPYCSSCPG